MKRILVIILLFICQSLAFSYESFTQRLGTVIDSEERSYFGLFPSVDGFQSAEFTQVAIDSGYFQVKYLAKGQVEAKSFFIKKNELKWLSLFINDFESIFTVNDNKRYPNFDSINFHELGKTYIKYEYIDHEFDKQTFYMKGGDKLTASVIWCDSLNLLVSQSDTLLNWRDFSNLRLINSKDIEYISSYIPYYMLLSKEDCFQWHRTGRWFSMFRDADTNMCLELKRYIATIDGQLQRVVPEKPVLPPVVYETRDMNNYFSLEVNTNHQSAKSIEGAGHIYFIRANHTRDNHVWENYHSRNDASSSTVYGANLHFRFSKHWGVSAGVKLSDTPDIKDDSARGYYVFNSLTTKTIMYDFTLRKYFLYETSNRNGFFNRFEGGIYAGVVYSQTDIAASIRKIQCYPDVFNPASFSEKKNFFGAKFGAFGLVHIIDQLSFSASAEYYANQSTDIKNYTTTPQSSAYTHQYILLGMENQKINPNRFFFSLGLMINIR